MSQHLREVRVDDLLEELVLGGAWRRHDDLDLSEKQLETKAEDFLRDTVISRFEK